MLCCLADGEDSDEELVLDFCLPYFVPANLLVGAIFRLSRKMVLCFCYFNFFFFLQYFK